MLNRLVFREVRSFISKRTKFSWDHSSLLQVTPFMVKQHATEHKEWIASPDSTAVMKSISGIPTQQIDSGDMLEYMQNRRVADSPPITAPVAVRVISACLTYPLTLAYALSLLFPKHYEREQANVLIVGARAESSLDLLWWKELLYANHNVLQHSIRMIGPNLIPCKSIVGNVTCSVSIKDRHGLHDETLLRTLDISNNYMDAKTANQIGYSDGVRLHEHADCNSLLRWADVFILYNPGYGNESTRESWRPTMDLLLHTRKPIVCTAFGPHDLRRDLGYLDAITAETDHQDLGEPIDFLIPPHENPYKSFKCSWDDREKGDGGVIVTNHSIYAVQAK